MQQEFEAMVMEDKDLDEGQFHNKYCSMLKACAPAVNLNRCRWLKTPEMADIELSDSDISVCRLSDCGGSDTD